MDRFSTSQMKRGLENRIGIEPKGLDDKFFGADIELNIKLKPITNESYTEINYVEEIKKIKNPLNIEETEETKKHASKEKIKKIFGEFHGSANGYDLADDFIDDTEAFEEFIPQEYTTKIGGFYVNFGKLDYSKQDVTNNESKNTANIEKTPQIKSKKQQKPRNNGKTNTDTPTPNIPTTVSTPLQPPPSVLPQPPTGKQKTTNSMLNVPSLSGETPVVIVDVINALIDSKYEFKNNKDDFAENTNIIKLAKFLVMSSMNMKNNIHSYISAHLKRPKKEIAAFCKIAERTSLDLDVDNQIISLQTQYEEFTKDVPCSTPEEYIEYLTLNKRKLIFLVETLFKRYRSVYSRNKFDFATVQTFLNTRLIPHLGAQFPPNILSDFCKEHTSVKSLIVSSDNIESSPTPKTQQKPIPPPKNSQPPLNTPTQSIPHSSPHSSSQKPHQPTSHPPIKPTSQPPPHFISRPPHQQHSMSINTRPSPRMFAYTPPPLSSKISPQTYQQQVSYTLPPNIFANQDMAVFNKYTLYNRDQIRSVQHMLHHQYLQQQQVLSQQSPAQSEPRMMKMSPTLPMPTTQGSNNNIDVPSYSPFSHDHIYTSKSSPRNPDGQQQ